MVRLGVRLNHHISFDSGLDMPQVQWFRQPWLPLWPCSDCWEPSTDVLLFLGWVSMSLPLNWLRNSSSSGRMFSFVETPVLWVWLPLWDLTVRLVDDLCCWCYWHWLIWWFSYYTKSSSCMLIWWLSSRLCCCWRYW